MSAPPPPPPSNNETRTRILEAADELFSKRGYAAVTLRDIGAAVGIHHASLYYYAPGGKQQLFIEVMERNFQRHQVGLTQAIAEAGDDLRQQLWAVSDWLVTQPPMDFSRMSQADMRAIDESEAARLMTLAYNALREPIVEALTRAKASDLIHTSDLDTAAMALVSLVQSAHGIPGMETAALRKHLGRKLVNLLLDGLLKR